MCTPQTARTRSKSCGCQARWSTPPSTPVARAVAGAALTRLGALPAPEDFANVPGLGVRGMVDGHAILVGRERLLADWAVELPENLGRARAEAEASGRTAITVAWDGEARSVLEVADAVRANSAEAVTRLRALGLRPILLTGDNRAVAESVAHEVGIAPEDVIAEVLPQDKALYSYSYGERTCSAE